MQGWTVFHMICKLYNHYHELGTFHSSGLASLLHCRTLLSYTDAEVGILLTHDYSARAFWCTAELLACLFAVSGSGTWMCYDVYMMS